MREFFVKIYNFPSLIIGAAVIESPIFLKYNKQTNNMRRLIYDMFYADEISMDIAIKLLDKLNQVSLDLNQSGVKAYDPSKRGAADVSFVAEYVDGLDGLGVMGTGAHTPKETVNLKTIEALTKRTAILIYRLINQ